MFFDRLNKTRGGCTSSLVFVTTSERFSLIDLFCRGREATCDMYAVATELILELAAVYLPVQSTGTAEQS